MENQTVSKYKIMLEDLPEDFRELAETIGLEAALKIAQKWGGDLLYIPNLKSLEKCARNRDIRKKFNGCNHHELARAHGLTVAWIRKIVDITPSGRQPTGIDIDDLQLPLFPPSK